MQRATVYRHFPDRGGALRRLHRPLLRAPPAARPGALGARSATRTSVWGRAGRRSTPSTARRRRCSRRRSATRRTSRRRRGAAFRGYFERHPRHPDAWPPRARARRARVAAAIGHAIAFCDLGLAGRGRGGLAEPRTRSTWSLGMVASVLARGAGRARAPAPAPPAARTRRSKPSPAASAAIGSSEVSVRPGIAFASSTCGPSGAEDQVDAAEAVEAEHVPGAQGGVEDRALGGAEVGRADVLGAADLVARLVVEPVLLARQRPRPPAGRSR